MYDMYNNVDLNELERKVERTSDMTGVRSPSAKTKASYGVRLTKPVLLRELCKRLSMWL